MNKDEALQEITNTVLNIKSNNILLEFATGTGKSKIALEKIHQLKPKGKILIVVPRLVLRQNWQNEFTKWNFNSYLPQVEFTTYISLPKRVGCHYNAVIYDEAHHISERCQKAIPLIHSDHNILLSATIKRTLKPILFSLFTNLYVYKISLKDATDDEILPEPRIVLIPLPLETSQPTELLEIRPKAPNQKYITYDQWLKGKFQYLKGNYNYGVKVSCTQKQKYREICEFMESCNKKLQSNLVTGIQKVKIEQARKRKGLERLQWLAEIKSDFVKQLLKQLRNYRTLTFCYSIKQTENLGKYCINSHNRNSYEYLRLFNDKKIKHITSVNILNEGVSLSECKCGVFAVYNTSVLMSTQKWGRLLRHKNPVFYLPYYVGTKEEEIINNMIENYDSSLIVRATNPFNFDEYIN